VLRDVLSVSHDSIAQMTRAITQHYGNRFGLDAFGADGALAD
jgi:hypothetical protein